MSAGKIQADRVAVMICMLRKFRLYQPRRLAGSQNWFPQNFGNSETLHSSTRSSRNRDVYHCTGKQSRAGNPSGKLFSPADDASTGMDDEFPSRNSHRCYGFVEADTAIRVQGSTDQFLCGPFHCRPLVLAIPFVQWIAQKGSLYANATVCNSADKPIFALRCVQQNQSVGFDLRCGMFCSVVGQLRKRFVNYMKNTRRPLPGLDQ